MIVFSSQLAVSASQTDLVCRLLTLHTCIDKHPTIQIVFVLWAKTPPTNYYCPQQIFLPRAVDNTLIIGYNRIE